MTSTPSSTARPLLTAAMIVRDEEHHIGGCLRSLAGIADEVVVVDTGSTDATVEVARAHGAVVRAFEWCDDFARARNEALDVAQGEWILYVDADERVRSLTPGVLDHWLGEETCVAYRVLLYPHAHSRPCREYRLWRNDPRIRFVGVIHEKVVPSIQAVAEADRRRVGVCDLTIDHLGYEGDQSAKHRRNLPLLLAQVENEPGNVFNWRHLARVHFALGQTSEGEVALERALTAIRETQAPAPVGALVFAELVDRHRGTPRASTLILEAMTTYPQDPVVVWSRAVLALDDDEPELALHWLDRLLEPDGFTLDDAMSYDRRLFDAWPHAARGLSLFRLGRHDEAAMAYRAAERVEPELAEHRVKRQMCEHLARERRGRRRTVDIADVLVEFVSPDGLHARAIDAVVGLLPDEDPALADATIDFAAATAPDQVNWQHADGDVRARWDDNGLQLAHGSMRAWADEGGAFVTGNDDVRRAFRQLFPYVLTHVLATRERFVLHGGAVVRDERALLILGPTGSGKSTLAVGAAAAGWTVLSDDLVAVRLTEHGVELRGIAKALLVPQAVAARLQLEGEPVDNDRRGRWRVTGVEGVDRWYPLEATAVSVRSDGPAIEVRRLAGHELLSWLLFSFLAARDEHRLPLYLPVASAITRLGGGTVAHGPHLDGHGAAIEELLAAAER